MTSIHSMHGISDLTNYYSVLLRMNALTKI